MMGRSKQRSALLLCAVLLMGGSALATCPVDVDDIQFTPTALYIWASNAGSGSESATITITTSAGQTLQICGDLSAGETTQFILSHPVGTGFTFVDLNCVSYQCPGDPGSEVPDPFSVQQNRDCDLDPTNCEDPPKP